MCPPPPSWSLPQPCSGGAILNGDIHAGDPISVSSGNVYYAVKDYETVGENKLSFIRSYNSRGNVLNRLGANWRSNYDRLATINGGHQTIVIRPDGQQLVFNSTDAVHFSPDTDTDMTLVRGGTGWTLTDHDDNVEFFNTITSTTPPLTTITKRNGYVQTLAYNANGYLATVTDSYSRVLTFTYNTDGTLHTLGTPDGTTITYGYTSTPDGTNLTSVTYPTSQTVSYVYGNSSQPHALTNVVDENSNTYLTWTYDAYGRGLTSVIGNGANANTTTLTYNDTTGSRTVTNTLGVTETYNFSTLQNEPKVTSVSRAATATTPAMSRSFTYDTNGYLASSTDWNGNSTTYTNNAHGDPTIINEAVGSSPSVARTTTITYDTTWIHQPASIVTPGVTLSFTYDVSGNTHTKTLTDTTTTTIPYSTNGQTRIWTYTYANHMLASVQNPRTDLTAITYLNYGTDGALLSIQDPMSHSTFITSHQGGGLPLTIVDPNSVTTTLTYDGRQRPLSSAVSTTAGTRTTSWSYANNGDVTTTLPDGSQTITALDSAHRSLGFSNNLGEQYNLTLDSYGDATAVGILNSAAANVYSRTGTFDALGRQLTDTSVVTGQSYTRTFDKNGNALTITDPLSHATTQVFDALNRLYKSTDANAGITQLTFDAHDRPLTVSDPDSNVTSYVYDGFGNMIQEASPDKGTTVFHYDGQGNLTQKVDAASVVENRTFDALDRPLTVTYPADATLNVAFTYDQTGHGKGIGRLTSLTDAAGSLSRSYDERGNMLTETRTVGTTNYPTTYSYDAASRVASITYPSGTLVTNGRDAVGRVTSITTKAPGSASVTLASGVTYEPFGPVTGTAAFNGDSETFTFDKDYRMTSLITTATNGAQHQTFGYDNANNLTGITDTVCPTCSATLGYDVVNRLTSAASWYGSYAYTMDKNGNFLTNNEQGYPATYSYTAGKNQISSITVGGAAYPVSYTATGNITNFTRIPGQTTNLTYNKANQIASSTGAGTAASYGYDAFRQRFSKTDSGSPATLYFYDLAGNTIEEADGGTAYDYIWLNNRAIGTLTPSTNTLAFLHGDRLGSPQLATDSAALISQQFSYTPYAGTSMPYQQSGSASITQNNRYPGQLFDPETLMNHNGFRDFSPSLGRYVQADPIGLAGGTNPYGYAKGNPINLFDRMGLAVGDAPPPPPGYDPKTWPSGTDPASGRPYVQDPGTGNTFSMHPEDEGHWRHWDIEDPSGKDMGRCPKNSKKPWPTQKRPPYGDQSPTDPSGNEPGWEPPQPEPVVPWWIRIPSSIYRWPFIYIPVPNNLFPSGDRVVA